MAPFDPNDPTSGIDTHPDVTNYGWGIPAGYNNQALALSSQEAKAEDQAMAYLRDSLRKSPEVTPTQGIATALLAAIPTLGGYLIGNAVGEPDLPEGFYGADLSKYQTGGAAGGLAGAQVGLTAAGGYLKGLEADQAQKNDVYQKMAQIESQKATRLGTKEDALVQAGLAAQQRKDELLDPEIIQAKINLAGGEAAAQARARQQYATPSEAEGAQILPEDIKRQWAERLKISPDLLNTKKDLDRAVSLYREGGVQGRSDRIYDRNDLRLKVDGLEIPPDRLPTEDDAKQVKTLKQNTDILVNSLIPNARAALTNPDTSIEDKQAAIANLVIAVKNTQGMGANFTALEEQLVKAGLPRIAALDAGSLISAMKATLQGQDSLAKLDKLAQLATEAANIGYVAHNYVVPKTMNNGGGVSAPAGFNPNDPDYIKWKTANGVK